MYSYRLNIAIRNGETFDGKPAYRHLFRTDWLENKQTAYDIAEQLRGVYPDAQITLARRCNVLDTEEI